MFYTYEGSIIRESEGGYTVAVPSFECMVAGGTSVKEACENAAGCLQLVHDARGGGGRARRVPRPC